MRLPGRDSRNDRPFGKWQAHSEPRAASRPVAERTDRAAVHLHERANQGKADPESFRTAYLTRGYLGEHIKHVFEGLRRNTYTVVLNGDSRLVVLMIKTESDVSTGLGVFGGIQE